MTLPDNAGASFEIDDPAPLDSPKWDDLVGRLILITPADEKEMPLLDDTGGTRMVIHGRVVILDGPGSPEVWGYTPIFPRYLQGQVRPNMGTGRHNLGRLARDPGRQKPRQTVPWVLDRPSPADRAAAEAFLRALAAGQITPGAHTPTSTTQSPGAGQMAEPPF